MELFKTHLFTVMGQEGILQLKSSLDLTFAYINQIKSHLHKGHRAGGGKMAP